VVPVHPFVANCHTFSANRATEAILLAKFLIRSGARSTTKKKAIVNMPPIIKIKLDVLTLRNSAIADSAASLASILNSWDLIERRGLKGDWSFDFYPHHRTFCKQLLTLLRSNPNRIRCSRLLCKQSRHETESCRTASRKSRRRGEYSSVKNL
jgi:hypothetical protein